MAVILGTSQMPKESPLKHHWQFLLQLEKSLHLQPRKKPLRTPAKEDTPETSAELEVLPYGQIQTRCSQ